MQVAESILAEVRRRGEAEADDATMPGASREAWGDRRVAAFKHLLSAGAPADPAYVADNDLLPADHPRSPSANLDAWEALASQEETLAALQKNAIERVTRAGVRKLEDPALAQLNARLAKVYSVHFEGNVNDEAITGLGRESLLSAAAVVLDEAERRGLVKADATHGIYTESLPLRIAGRTPAKAVTKLCAVEEGVQLVVDGLPRVLCTRKGETAAEGESALTLRAARWAASGSRYHAPMVEPAAVPYQVGSEVAKGVEIGDVVIEPGARGEHFAEFFTQGGGLTGIMVFTDDAATLRKSLVPFVLTPEAVAKGWMPPEGESALPASLEQDVPLELRYWRAKPGIEARELRDQLVKAGLFAEGGIGIVDDTFRRIYTKTFVPAAVEQDPHHYPATVEKLDPLQRALEIVGVPTDSEAVRKVQGEFLEDEDTAFVMTDLADGAADDLDFIETLGAMGGDYLIAHEDTPENRDALAKLGTPFRLAEVDDRIFVASVPIISKAIQFIAAEGETPDAPREFSIISKADDSAEERMVYGIVLEPDVVDSQSDTYDEATIRVAAHRFMQEFRNVGFMHKALINDQVKILESYLAPVDFEIDGQTVKKGTWLMAARVESDPLWEAIKQGQLTGFSIGGSARRAPA